MIDIHAHILYETDDGSRSVEESLKILEQASKNGVTDIVLTPHYIKNTRYNLNNKQKKAKLSKLKKLVKENNININLYIGNEVYIDEDITSLLETDISTINNTKYILIEFPMNIKPIILDEVLYQLDKYKLIPIIAHPERYTSYFKDFNFFYDLIEKGCLLQGNIGSIYGIYGSRSKKMIKEMLKRNMIHLLASDTHHLKDKIYENNINKTLLKIVKDEQKVEDLLVNNPQKIIENKNLNHK